MSPAQCKAARYLLGWSARQLAAAAEVSHATLLAFEGSKKDTNPRTVRAIREALESAGADFVGKGSRPQAEATEVRLADGSAVRLRARRAGASS